MTSLLPFVLCHLLCLLLHQFPPSPANHPTKSTSPFFTQTCYLPTLLFYLVSNERTSKMDILCLSFCIHSFIFRCFIFLPIYFRYPHYCCMGFNLFHFDEIEGHVASIHGKALSIFQTYLSIICSFLFLALHSDFPPSPNSVSVPDSSRRRQPIYLLTLSCPFFFFFRKQKNIAYNASLPPTHYHASPLPKYLRSLISSFFRTSMIPFYRTYLFGTLLGFLRTKR